MFDLVRVGVKHGTGRRQMLVNKRSLWRGSPLKSLCKTLGGQVGRTNGQITHRTRRIWHKRKLREIDWEYSFHQGKVLRLEYDPNRSAFIALIDTEGGGKRYILAAHKMQEGDYVYNYTKKDSHESSFNWSEGSMDYIDNVMNGMEVYNIALYKDRRAAMVRSAGTCGKVISKSNNMVLVSLPSGERRWIHGRCRCCMGRVSNINRTKEVLGKASRSLFRGKKQKVSGGAMGPHDHPMGGRGSKGRHPCSQNGLKSKGYKTVRGKRLFRGLKKYIVRR